MTSPLFSKSLDMQKLATCAVIGILFIAAGGYGGSVQAAPTLKVLFSFMNLRGELPIADLLADGAGNLFGTTYYGGPNGDGVVFELSPPAAGKTAWTEKVIHAFNGTNGSGPYAGLIADSAGNLYGTTEGGGSSPNCGGGCGVVFKMSPPPAGQTAWTYKVLHSFNGTNGQWPAAGVIMDGAGNLYGNTYQGGTSDGGVVFKMSPPQAGQTAWTYKVLQNFDITASGAFPNAGLLLDGAGNLYGTTLAGVTNGNGEVFELFPPAAGQTKWTQAIIHAFNGADGSYPDATLIADGAGNLYGTTDAGGANSEGEVFELSPPAAGQTTWTQTVLHSFSGTDGDNPAADLIFDSVGNLYGTTGFGGSGTHPNCGGDACGVVFKLSPPLAGQTAWTETVLVSLKGTNGQEPLAGVIMDGAGNLYGTTYLGGAHDMGVVFMLTP